MSDSSTAITRTAEIEEPTNRYFIHPLSRIFARLFARHGIRPNTVSIVGMILGILSAIAYYGYESWMMSVTGFLLMVGWHVMDGADGQLARLTGQTSEFGRVLDGVCDHLTFVLVYFSLALALTPSMGAWVWVLGLLAGISHVFQAGLYEYQRISYDYWVHGKASPVMDRKPRADAKHKRGAAGLFYRISNLYSVIQQQLADDAPLHDRFEAVSHPSDRTAFRAAYRDVHMSGFWKWNLLSSNYRTAAIFIACIAGNPSYYFLFEIVVLNMVLAYLLSTRRKTSQSLLLPGEERLAVR